MLGSLIDVDPDGMPVLVDIQNDALSDLSGVSTRALGKVDVEAVGVWKILNSHGLNPRSGNALWIVRSSASVTTRK